MGSTFSSAFENTQFEYRTVESTFSSLFKTIHTFIIELWDRHSALHSKIFILNIELWNRRSALHSRQHTLWLSSCEFNMQHSSWISSCVIDIQLCIQNHTQFWISSCGFDIQLCIRNYSYWTSSYGSTFSSAFNTIHTLNIELWDRLIALHSKTYIMIFKEWFVLNVELNVDLTARYSGRIFSNAELNVDPIARYSKYVWCWMQSWTSIS